MTNEIRRSRMLDFFRASTAAREDYLINGPPTEERASPSQYGDIFRQVHQIYGFPDRKDSNPEDDGPSAA